MTRGLTIAVYVVLVAAIVALQVVAVVGRRLPTIGAVVRAAMANRVVRVLFLAAWLWVGWHVFARADHG